MKKVLLFAIVTLFTTTAFSQGFRIGANAGIPIGDASDFTSFYVSLDADYDWAVSETIDLGVASGVAFYTGKDGGDGLEYLPIAGSVDVNVSDDVSVGGDVGYAVNIGTGGGGDLYYRFQIRYQASDEWDVSARMNNISGDGITFSSLTLGVGYRF